MIPSMGIPRSYARDAIPKIERYPGGQTATTPKAIDFVPGTLLGSVSGELGLRKFLEGFGHTFVVTRDKEGPNSVFERELPDADIVISQLFWPAYLTAEDREGAKTEVINSCTPASEPIPAVIASNSDYRNDLETHELFASDVMPRFA